MPWNDDYYFYVEHDCECTGCSWPIYRGERAYFSQELGDVYCCKACALKDIPKVQQFSDGRMIPGFYKGE